MSQTAQKLIAIQPENPGEIPDPAELGLEYPAVKGETYWCFTPDQLEGALANYKPFWNSGRDELMRAAVRAFLHSVSVREAGMRKEAGAQRKVSSAYGGGS